MAVGKYGPYKARHSSAQGGRRDRKLEWDAGKGLGETRTDALLSQLETGKISYVHYLPCARLTPGVYTPNAAFAHWFRPNLDSPRYRPSLDM